MKQPLLTVVMPAYNTEKYIKEAIDSVLNQTFQNFELLIINDGSTDGTTEVVKKFNDKRIRLIELSKNKGIAHCRNLGLKEAKGEYLAWIDSDDINLPTRFEKQINFLEENQDFGGCGTWLSRFKGDKTLYVLKVYANSEKIRAALLFKPASIPNSTAMLRMNEIKKHELWYNEELKIAEDYDFIFRCSRKFNFSNIQEVLYKYRDSETSIMKEYEDQDQKSFDILKTVFEKVLATLDIFPGEDELRTHYEISSRNIFTQFSEYERCYFWLQKLQEANDQKEVYNKNLFCQIIADQFFFLSKKASCFGIKTLVFYINRSIENKWKIHPKNYFKLAVRCALKYDKFEFKLT